MDVGMLGRFFGRLTGGNWRPPAEELAFAAATGFDTVQIRSDRAGELEALLDAVPALGLVWDVNHTRAEETQRFLALRERITLAHVSDTPLPETNHHLPLGRGNVDFEPLRELEVPLILEIGGLPHS